MFTNGLNVNLFLHEIKAKAGYPNPVYANVNYVKVSYAKAGYFTMPYPPETGSKKIGRFGYFSSSFIILSLTSSSFGFAKPNPIAAPNITALSVFNIFSFILAKSI